MGDEATLRALLDTMTDGVIVMGPDSRIETFNASAERMFGYEASEVVGQGIEILMPEPHRSLHARYVARYLSSGTGRVIGVGGREVEALRKDGTIFPAEIAIGAFVEAGARRFTGVIRDLTDRKLAENKLRQAQKLEAIGRLAAGIAHDFNNVLMSLTGCLEMSSSRVGEGHEARSYIDAAMSEVARGGRIAKQLLAFGRTGGQKKQVVAADRTIGETVPLLRRLLGVDIDFDVRLNAGESCLECRSGELEQLVFNLAINARDAMPRGGTLTIETSLAGDAEALPSELQGGEYISIRISDTGSGMDHDTVAQIFDPFFTTKGEEKGTGLGLAVVQSVADGAGGAIRVDSEPGRGTTFEVYFPVVEPRPADAGIATARAPSPEVVVPARILVAEDEPLVLVVVRQHLEDAGHEVICAGDGIRAIELARENAGRIDLVLSDVMLPGAGGAEIMRAALEHSPDAAALFMSAHPHADLLEKGLVLEGIPALQKPFGRDGLLLAVGVALDGRKTRPAPSSAHRVLLVEDQPGVRLAMQYALEEIGMETRAVSNGREAILAIESASSPYDIVVTDVGLPDMTGWTLAEELREREPGLGIVFASGSPGVGEGPGSTLERATSVFLPKPASLRQIESAVRQVLRARAQASGRSGDTTGS